MKKILRIPIIVILLLWVWFMYVVKNPTWSIAQTILTTLWIDTTTTVNTLKPIDLTTCRNYFDGCNTCTVSGWVIGGCTRMYCEIPTEPKCLEPVTTGIDLTNCISYFDGCNNCSVENGKPSACTLMYCETPTQPKCNQYANETENTGTIGLANPASTNCINNWWTLNLVTSSDGGQVGMCTLSDGTVCEERAYMRGECWTTTNTGEAWVSPGNPWSTPGSEWPTACTMEYAPVCAKVILPIECAANNSCPPAQQTFGNRCMMNANKSATFLHDGECTTK